MTFSIVRSGGINLSQYRLPALTYSYCNFKRFLRVVAIETSCDDTSVSLLETQGEKVITLKHLKKTLNSVSMGGIVPIDAIKHHQINLPLLLQEILRSDKEQTDVTTSGNMIKPDMVMVTRGPGMIGSLSVGLNIAKGFCIGKQIPLLGINHMLGHLLIPRMNMEDCKFPILSLLVSGGHTLLVYSENLVQHKILCDTVDIAIGDSLDKCGRAIGLQGIMIGKELEKLSEPLMNKYIMDTKLSYFGKPEKHSKHEYSDKIDTFVKLPNPFSKHNKHITSFSFASFISTLTEQLPELPPGLLDDIEIKKQLAFLIQRQHFNHLISKIKQTLHENKSLLANVTTFICSGGVSSNKLLRQMLEESLNGGSLHEDTNDKIPDYSKDCGYDDGKTDSMVRRMKVYYPQAELCTDNSIMIGYAGIELLKFFQSHQNKNLVYNNLDILPMRKWSLEKLTELSDWQFEE